MRSNVVLNHEDWDNFRPLLIENKIRFETSGYGHNVYISLEVNDEQYKLVDELLERI